MFIFNVDNLLIICCLPNFPFPVNQNVYNLFAIWVLLVYITIKRVDNVLIGCG